MERIRQRDPQALVDAYAAYGKRVFSLIFRIVQNRPAAEEILQDTFMRLWDRVPEPDAGRVSLLPWLLCVGRNCALDYLRKESRRGAYDVLFTDEIGEAAFLGEESWSEDDAEGVRDALETLPPEQKKLIEMAYFDGLTQVEMAEKTGESLGTVKSRIRLGLKKLRNLLSGTESGLRR